MTFKRTVLPNGLRVITIPMPSFESATVMVMAGAGSRYEKKNTNGISHFLEHMAFKGTKSRPTPLEIASLIDGLGGENNAFTGKETTAYYIKAQATHIETMLDILSDMLKNSLFDSAEIEKEKGVIIEELNMYEDTPMRKLGDIYEQLLYGDTPMGWDIGGTKEVIRAVKREDFISYMQSLYSADNMTVVVSGGVEAEKVETLVTKYFGDFEKFATIHAPKVAENQEKPAVLIHTKKTEQTHIAIGVRTIPLEHEDRYPLDILAAIMGGGMSSRLFHEVREKRGLAYYVRTNSDNYTDVGTLVTSAGVDPLRVEEAIKVIIEQHAEMRKPGNITKDEFNRAKELLKGHFVLDLEDSRSVASFYAHQEILESHLDNPDEVLAKVDKVSMEDIERVTSKYMVNSTLNLAAIGNIKESAKFEELLKL
jgi:predicted Zn-dependent peptidase